MLRTLDHLKNNQYLAYVMEDILRLKNRAILSSCRLPGLQKYMGCRTAKPARGTKGIQ